MKKWIFTIIIVLIAIAIFYAVSGGLKWQPLTILFAALAAPLRFFAGLLGGSEEEIRKRHEVIREGELLYQKDLETKIRERQEAIQALEKEIELMDAKLVALEEKRARIHSEIKNMTIEERQKAGQDLFGE